MQKIFYYYKASCFNLKKSTKEDMFRIIKFISPFNKYLSHIGILGYDVYVDIYGDAEGNYTLLTFDVHREEGGVELVPAGNFSMTRNGTGIPVRTFECSL